MWRAKQLEQSWILSAVGDYADFAALTARALDVALGAHGIADAALRADLLGAYRRLDAFADAAPALAALRSRGLATAILSNGEPAMLAEATEAAGLAPLLDAVLSVHPLRRYKPAPEVYALATGRFACAPGQIAFVSGNAWDAFGAARFGFRVFWLNRAGPPGVPVQPEEYGLDTLAAARIATLADLPARSRMTPAARLQAAIDLLDAVEAEPRRPADAIANDFFRARRYIGGGDRRAVSELAWGAVRQRLRLDWHWRGSARTPAPRDGAGRLPAAGRRLDAAEARRAFHRRPLRPAGARPRGGRGWSAAWPAARCCDPAMPEGVRAQPAGLGDARPARTASATRLAEEAAAMEEAAPLDLRANLLRDHAGAGAARAGGGGHRGDADAALALGAARRRPPPDRRHRRLPRGADRGAGRGQPAHRAARPMRGRACGWRITAPAPRARPWRWRRRWQNRGHIVACDVSAPRLEGAGRRLRRAGVDNAERHLLEPGDKWRKRRAEQLRPRAGGCALHRHRHLAAQPGCAAAHQRTRPD